MKDIKVKLLVFIIPFVFLTITVFAQISNINNISSNGLPALFPNIESVCKYFDENMIDNKINYKDIIDKLHYCFSKTEYSGLFGYNWNSGIVIADINKDGIYELYLNGSIGSGFVHSFIHCYDPAEDKYYIISKRMDMDYILFVYKNDVYVFGDIYHPFPYELVRDNGLKR